MKSIFDILKWSFLKTDLVEFLTNLIENKDQVGLNDSEIHFFACNILHLLLQRAVELKEQNTESEVTDKLKAVISNRPQFVDFMYAFNYSPEIALFCYILADKDSKQHDEKYQEFYGTKRRAVLKARAHKEFDKIKQVFKKDRNIQLQKNTLLNFDQPQIQQQDPELSDNEIEFVEDLGEWLVWGEEILSEDFQNSPFGYNL